MGCKGNKIPIVFADLGEASGASVNINITGEAPIEVTSTLVNGAKNVNIKYNPYYPLQASMNIDAIATSPITAKAGLVPLKGATVISVDVSYVINKNGVLALVYHTINGTAISPLSTRQKTIATSIAHNTSLAGRTITLLADDQTGNVGGIATVAKTIEFGNRIYYGEGPIVAADEDLITMITAFSSAITLSKLTQSYLAKSLDPAVRVYFAIPTDMGATEFRDSTSTLDIDPMMKIKSGLAMSNGVLTSEPYDIYMAKTGSLKDSNIRPIS